jgi:hypothetical protein
MANEGDPKTPQPPADPRYVLVFEPNLVTKGPRPRPRRVRASASGTSTRGPLSSASFSGVLRELNGLRERSGAVLGDAYARAAKSFLERWERFEDRAAERRQRQRSQRRRSSSAPAAASAAKTPSPAK